jgi:hypothetical protein
MINFLRFHSVRICADFLLCILIFMLPWWAVVILALLFSLYFDRFYEIVFFALIVDGMGGVLSFGAIPPFTTGAFGVLIITPFLKRFLVPLPRV